MCYIEINGWSANIRFSSAHTIPEYNKCGRLHGHTYAIHAKVYGEPDDKGIIVDFRYLKDALKEIAEKLDHKVLIPGNNPNVEIVEENGEIKLSFNEKKYVLPREDCIVLPIPSTSAENLARYVADVLFGRLRDFENIREIEVGIDEGYGQGARIRKKIR